MSKKSDAWGLEVGANAIKAIRLVADGAHVRLAEYDVLPFKHILTTPDLNADEAIQLSLDQFIARHDVTKSTIVASVPGNAAFARFAKLPPVEPKKIPDIVKFEAVQQIPFPIEQVEWDYQVFADPDSPDVEVGIFAITKEKVGQLLANYRAVGVKLDGLTLSPLGVYNAMAYDMDLDADSEGVILMDIGTSSTDIIIVEHGDLWLRTLPLGGNNFTEALVRAFKLSFPKAEKLKREAGTSKYARQIFQAMRPVFADLVQEIQRSLGFYQTLNRDAKLERLIGFGSTFRLPGLQKFLKQQLQIDVVRPDGFEKISVEGSQSADFSDNALNMATAYGLALQGLGIGKIDANILPAQILRQRIWKQKQPWFGAAAAVFLVAAVLAGIKIWSVSNAFHSQVDKNQLDVQRIISRAQNNFIAWEEVIRQSDLRPLIENERRVLDYRSMWPMLLGDISDAVASLNKDQQQLYAGKYKEIRRIPRNQRRRIYIESMEVTYVPVTALSSATPRAATAVASPYEMQLPGGTGTATTTEDPATPHAFMVRLTGWTPYKGASTLILDELPQWLRNHAEQPGRPYKFVLPSNVATISPRPYTPDDGPDGRPAPSGRPGPVGAGRTVGPTPGFGDFGGGPTFGSQPPTAPEAGGMADIKSLFPVRPLMDEAGPDDQSFEMTFYVQILPPDQARLSVAGAQAEATAAPAAPADGTAPATPPTPATPASTIQPTEVTP
ncbi:MAG: type IV pilus assembly protein PilM [Phycisphaeraceae bacterium]